MNMSRNISANIDSRLLDEERLVKSITGKLIQTIEFLIDSEIQFILFKGFTLKRRYYLRVVITKFSVWISSHGSNQVEAECTLCDNSNCFYDIVSAIYYRCPNH